MLASVLTKQISRPDLFDKVALGQYYSFPSILTLYKPIEPVIFLARDEMDELIKNKLIDSLEVLTAYRDSLPNLSKLAKNNEMYPFEINREDLFLVYPSHYNSKLFEPKKTLEYLIAKNKIINGEFYIQHIPPKTKTVLMVHKTAQEVFFNLEGNCIINEHRGPENKIENRHYLDKGIIKISAQVTISIETMDLPAINVVLKKNSFKYGCDFDAIYIKQ